LNLIDIGQDAILSCNPTQKELRMKEIQDIIINRRSIRKYKTNAVSQHQIEKLLQAAMYAPSANNLQPWHFVVVTERSTLNQIMDIHPYAKMLKNAPLAILVCADQQIEKTEGYWVQDCSAAIQNIMLSAYGMGLASVWLGVYPRQERMLSIKKLFSLPEHIHPLSIVAVGHADEQKELPERYLAERIHLNQW
jgi:nitroreductase